MKLANYIKQIRGVSYKPKDVLNHEEDGYIPLLRANNIKDGKINFDNLVYVKREKVKKEQIMQYGDILVCTSSGSKDLVGKAGTLRSKTEFTFGAFCKVIRPINIDNEYLASFFQSKYYRNTISRNSRGANINNLKQEDFDGLDINIPDEKEQLKIANKIKMLFNLITTKKEQISKCDELVKSQFIEMFGDIRNENFACVPIMSLVDTNITKVKKKFASDDIIKYIDISSIDNVKNEIIGYTEYNIGDEPSRAQQCLIIGDILI